MTVSIHQLTRGPHGHILANRACWTCDGQSLLFDTREDETQFTADQIERVHLDGTVESVYASSDGARCGVPTCSPIDDQYVFLEGPGPIPDSLVDIDRNWPYTAWHRQGKIGRLAEAGKVQTLDARDIVPPFTPGALRGGTHLHVFSGDATLVASTYEDHVLAELEQTGEWRADRNRRVVAVSRVGQSVTVPRTHPRNHDGVSFTTVVTEVHDAPRRGSDQICRACSEAWVGSAGYLRADGKPIHHALAFQGVVVDAGGHPVPELFICDLPDRFDDGLQDDFRIVGTPRSRPGVPSGVVQRRLTYTTGRPFPGLAGPRHWAVSAPDGSRIGFFMRDADGRVAFWTISPHGGDPVRITGDAPEPTSAFSWHPDGSGVTYVADGRVQFVRLADGVCKPLTPPVAPGARRPSGHGPRHHACVFSPNGKQIAFMMPAELEGHWFDQLYLVELH